MLEPGQDPDLEQEPLGGLAQDDLGTHQLDRDGAVVLAVAGQVDHGHPAPSQLPLDLVAVADGGMLEDGRITRVRHG